MVCEASTKAFGERPPIDGNVKTGFFDGSGDDRDMLTWLSDQVTRLMRQAREPSDQALLNRALTWVHLFDIRERWILGEMAAEEMLENSPSAPLGIDSDPLDLTVLNQYGASSRRWQYERLLEQVRQAKAEILAELGDPIGDLEPS